MKPIKMSPTQRAAVLADFEKFLDTTRSLDDNVTYKVSTEKILKATTPTIYITPEAYLKMYGLVDTVAVEVAWHGSVTCPNPGIFIIDDIHVYPQYVSGTSVDTEQAEYETWLQGLDDDTFNSLRMQGHSHVNMSASPSGPDWVLYEKMLQGMTRIPYYIFLIVNKRREMFIMLYDFEQNMIFETKELDMGIIFDSSHTLQSWATLQKKHVKQETFKPNLPDVKVTYAEKPYTETTYAAKARQQQLDAWDKDYENRVYAGYHAYGKK